MKTKKVINVLDFFGWICWVISFYFLVFTTTYKFYFCFANCGILWLFSRALQIKELKRKNTELQNRLFIERNIY